MAPLSTAKFRTKTGCLQCRRRRKKCDEKRPRCAGCTRNTLECGWPSGNDLADQRRDRQTRSDTRNAPFQTLGGLSFHKLPPPVSMPYPFQLQRHCYLYRYFASELLPRLVRQESLARYGDQTYMLRLAMEFPPLMGALVSIASMNLTSSRHWPISRAIESYVQTLIELQESLKQYEHSRSGDAILATVITLSVFESFRVDAPPDATPHITASGILLSQRRPRWSSCPQAAAVFDRICIESFVYHASLMMLYDPKLDVLSSTRLDLDLPQYFSDPTHAAPAGLGLTPVTQPILHASYKLFLLLADATKLARLQRRLHDQEISTWRQLQRELWEWIPMTVGYEDPSCRLYVIAVQILLLKADPDLSLVQIQQRIGESLKESLSIVPSIERSRYFSSVLLWPLSIFGCVAILDDEREVVRDFIEALTISRLGGQTTWILKRLTKIWSVYNNQFDSKLERTFGLGLLLHGA